MSYESAADLLKLARMAAASRQGVTYDQVAEAFGMSNRNAKRMVQQLENLFEVERHTDEDRRARFRILTLDPLMLPEKPDTMLEALELAIRGMEDGSAYAAALRDLRNALLIRMGQAKARRAEADAETLLDAYGHVAIPGPRTRKAPEVMQEIAQALRGPFLLEMTYKAKTRVVQPYGILQGVRGYLVAKQPEKGPHLLKFRLDLIETPRCLDESFELDEGFSIADHAAEGFGVLHDPKQLGEVVWRFLPDAAERAAEFVFHPRQQTERTEDGSLIVRFTTSGWTEMTWYLYQWGDKVEVLAPPELREMVEGYQRSDITALP
ncbi:helix-turn-helix transcriptional regulator [Sagittula sp.]|uniref:helix-turn-helix transcriptional regulator n=1 Tax=Sagittula sp. TaxID=2038081 RepID=UPI0035139EE6